MARKFIINNNDLILGNVEMHEDLLGGRKENKTIGGGFWNYDVDTNTMYFYGESMQFGSVTEEQLLAANKQLSVEKANIVFSTKKYFGEVLIEQQEKNDMINRK